MWRIFPNLIKKLLATCSARKNQESVEPGLASRAQATAIKVSGCEFRGKWRAGSTTGIRDQGQVETEISPREGHLDRDLAALYGVRTSALNQSVKRNRERFPPDFAFQLTAAELSRLMSQFVTSKGRGGVRKSPYVFTEHGALMAANVLRSRRAIEMSVFVVRAFTHHELSHVSVLTKHCPQDKAILDSLGDS